MRLSLSALLLLISLSLPAAAQGYPNALMAGEVQSVVGIVNFGGSCYVNRGLTTFQRNGVGPKAVISFDELVHASKDLRGQAVMTFNDAANGTVRFKITAAYYGGTVTANFSNYSESYSASTGTLTVRFSLSFGDCVLPITAVYDNTYN